jgi:hypothetical protein
MINWKKKLKKKDFISTRVGKFYIHNNTSYIKTNSAHQTN